MIFEQTEIRGVNIVRPEARQDERGLFARMFCADEFAAQGLETCFVQSNLSHSRHRGTLRGMHYQIGQAAEVKVVRCTAGSLYDVALDLRPNSDTFGKSFGIELSAANRTTLYIPRGCAHGFVTLSDDAEVTYLVSAAYSPKLERGVRYDDPRFAIAWPIAPTVISPKDAQSPDFDPALHGTTELDRVLRARTRQMIAVIGANGMIGSAVVAHLARSQNVVSVGRRAPSDVIADISEPAAVAQLELPGCKTLVHCAEVVDEDFSDPERAFRQATLGMAALVRRAAQLGVERFAYISTAHVYGPLVGRLHRKLAA